MLAASSQFHDKYVLPRGSGRPWWSIPSQVKWFSPAVPCRLPRSLSSRPGGRRSAPVTVAAPPRVNRISVSGTAELPKGFGHHPGDLGTLAITATETGREVVPAPQVGIGDLQGGLMPPHGQVPAAWSVRLTVDSDRCLPTGIDPLPGTTSNQSRQPRR